VAKKFHNEVAIEVLKKPVVHLWKERGELLGDESTTDDDPQSRPNWPAWSIIEK